MRDEIADLLTKKCILVPFYNLRILPVCGKFVRKRFNELACGYLPSGESFLRATRNN